MICEIDIVICKDKLYGLVGADGKELIPPYVTDMYVITSAGENQYYFTYQENVLDVIKYLRDTLKIQPVKPVSNNYDKESSNANQNTANNLQEQNTVNDM